jgi:hypothetical protein
MKGKWKGALIGGGVGAIIDLLLVFGFNVSWIFSSILIIVGVVSGYVFLLEIKIKAKLIISGGWYGFLLPYFYFAYISITCVGTHCGHLGMGIPIVVIYSVVTLFVGSLVGFLIGKFYGKR